MTRPNPQAIDTILAGAKAALPSERTAFIREACAGDKALEEAVISELQATVRVDLDATIDMPQSPDLDATIDMPQSPDLDATIDMPQSPDLDATIDMPSDGGGAAFVSDVRAANKRKKLPEQVADFRIIDRIGKGGMGEVYLAEQLHPRRLIALKVVRARLATPEAIVRFEAEGDTLARLSHPSIAQVYAAGVETTDERSIPYFAMEYVEDARELTAWADEHALNERQRLQLFHQVCEAVAHGHQRGVIHCDLKPGNILVGPEGQPKVIDFGVSQVEDADDADDINQAHQIVGTFQYMPPEQVESSADIDTSSDVYALGIVLYQLLTGDLPYEIDTTSFKAATKSVLNAPEVSMLDVRPGFGRDLDAIVRKAIAKNRGDRYRTASDFGDDIGRFLRDEPITAREQTASEAMRRFMRKHRAATSAITAVLLVIVVGLVAVSVFAYRTEVARAEEQRQRGIADTALLRVEAERVRLEKIAAFQSSMLQEIEADAMGDTLVQRLRDSVQDQSEIAGEDDDVIADHVAQLDMLAAVFNATDIAVGIIDVHLLDRALSTVPEQFENDPETEAAVREIVADSYVQLGLYDRAGPEYETALELRETIFGRLHEKTLESISDLGLLRLKQARLEEAALLFEEARAGRIEVLGEDHPETIASVQNLATLARASQDLPRAEELFRKAYESSKRINGSINGLTGALAGNVGVVCMEQGRHKEALPFLEFSHEVCREIYGTTAVESCDALMNLVQLERDLGNLSQASLYVTSAIAGYRASLGADHPDTMRALFSLGLLHVQQGRPAEGAEILRAVYNGQLERLSSHHPETMQTAQLLAQSLIMSQQFGLALEAVENIAVTMGELHGLDSERCLGWVDTKGLLLRDTGNFAEAEAVIQTVWDRCKANDALKDAPICNSVPSRFIRLYTMWNEAAPGNGHNQRALEWQEQLEAIEAGAPQN